MSGTFNPQGFTGYRFDPNDPGTAAYRAAITGGLAQGVQPITPTSGGLLGPDPTVPYTPTGGLLDPFMQKALAQLAPAQAGTTAATPGAAAVPAQRPAALDVVNAAAQLANKNAYGTADQEKLGALASAGFPMMSDPRVIQDQLATMAQAGDQDALETFRRMMSGGWGSGWGGYFGGGEGSGGGRADAGLGTGGGAPGGPSGPGGGGLA
jgi:hypothetical protein